MFEHNYSQIHGIHLIEQKYQYNLFQTSTMNFNTQTHQFHEM